MSISQPLLRAAALCNDGRIRDGQLIGDPTEGALLVLAAKGGFEPEALAERTPRIAEIPFDSAHKFMATFHHDGELVRLCVKGAPDVLLELSTWLRSARTGRRRSMRRRGHASRPKTRPWPGARCACLLSPSRTFPRSLSIPPAT